MIDLEKAAFQLSHTAQEVRDLFARFGSGDYTPTLEEIETVNAGLTEILSDFRRQLTEIPGEVVCPKCRFRLHRRVLRADTGQIYIDASPVTDEPCPNDGEIMRAITWEEDANETALVLLDIVRQLRSAQERLDELEKAN